MRKPKIGGMKPRVDHRGKKVGTKAQSKALEEIQA